MVLMVPTKQDSIIAYVTQTTRSFSLLSQQAAFFLQKLEIRFIMKQIMMCDDTTS